MMERSKTNYFFEDSCTCTGWVYSNMTVGHKTHKLNEYVYTCKQAYHVEITTIELESGLISCYYNITSTTLAVDKN